MGYLLYLVFVYCLLRFIHWRIKYTKKSTIKPSNNFSVLTSGKLVNISAMRRDRALRYAIISFIPFVVSGGLFCAFYGLSGGVLCYHLMPIDSISLIIRAWFAAWFRVGWVVSSYKRVGSLARFVQERSRYV